MRWHLSKTRTAFGVEVSYRYIIPEIRPNGETSLRHLPDKIIYAETSSGWNEVSFAYEERNDIRVSYANGPKRVESKRLGSIVVKGVVAGTTAVPGAVVSGTAAVVSPAHEYLLIYGNASHSPQSLLTEVKRQEVVSRFTIPGPIPGTQSIARFSYADSETTWGERERITIVGDPPPLNPAEPSEEYFSLAIPGDVNGDARPDMVVFNDTCFIAHNDQRTAGGDFTLPEFQPPPDYSCTKDHRVYLNTVQELRSFPSDVDRNAARAVEAIVVGGHTLQYDEERSKQVKDFYGSLHDDLLFLETEYAAMADLNRDGDTELLGSSKFAPGGPDGWGEGVAAPWLSLLATHQLADINGDGFPDLVGQGHYYLNTGVSTGESPYFDLQASVAIRDPVISGDYPTQYGTPSDSCLDSSDTGIDLRWDFGVNDSGDLSSDPTKSPGIAAHEWVWRNTVHADVNNDGIADRVISFPFLRETTFDFDFDELLTAWVRDDEDCGVVDQVFLGKGTGEFVAAGYGIGGPMQSELIFTQKRFVEHEFIDSESELYSFNYHVNQFALGDLDGDGRNEITQFCDNYASFLAMWDQGIGDLESYGPGYQIEAGPGVCPGQFTASVPEKFFGLSLFDYHLSTIEDFDGDGQSDLFMYSHPYGPSNVVVINTDTPWADWKDGLYWRRNLRSTAQNRLVSVTWPHGGSTRVTWAWSAEDPDNNFAINVEHVKSMTDENGKSTLSFTKGAFVEGEFLGFARAETLRPRGSTLVQTFFNKRILRNKPSTEELYDEGGRLKNLRVHVSGSEHPNPFGGGLLYDGLPPYYNPLQRVCEFEFGALNALVPIGADIDAYIAKCEAFDGEGGLVLGEGGPVLKDFVLDQRSIYSVIRGGDPISLAHSASERRELVALRGLLIGEDPGVICPPGANNAGGRSPTICTTPAHVRNGIRLRRRDRPHR